MPSVAVKLYSVFFKLLLKHRLQSHIQNPSVDPLGVTCRPEETVLPANPSFSSDGVATKDIHIDPLTSLSVRIFLPDPSLLPNQTGDERKLRSRRHSFAGACACEAPADTPRRRCSGGAVSTYRGYLPSPEACRSSGSQRMPVVLQFHGGAFVSGSCDSAANDFFCRRIARLCDVIVLAVGYRLAPESRYPAAFEDGLKVLNWLGMQANLAECSKSMGIGRVRCGGGLEARELAVRRHLVDAFGVSMVEPWLAAHADPSRCILLGVSCGANIADFVTRKAVVAGKLLSPVKVIAQVLICPFFMGSIPTQSELKLANSYFYDKAMCLLAWKLFLPKENFSLDHPAANPLLPGMEPPLRCMPPTLTVVAEHDLMKDRAVAYSEELRRANIDAPVLEYKDAVHEFATLGFLLSTPQAQASVEDIAIWMKKYISSKGDEFSY